MTHTQNKNPLSLRQYPLEGIHNLSNLTITKQSTFSAPPIAFKKAHLFTEFNTARTDNYYWLKERSNPMVKAYLNAENEYADKVMQSTESLQNKLFAEMRSRIIEDDITTPVYHNGYFYYTRTEKGKQYKLYCRKKGSLQADEELMFDVNQMASGKSAYIFADYEISSDNRYAAYSENETGSYAEFILKVRDLESGRDVSGFEITKVQDFVWANDNQTIFYTVNNEALRSWRVYRHDVFAGKPGVVVFEEPDELFILNLQKTKTNDYIFISSSSLSTSEYLLLEANNPLGSFESFMPKVKDVDYGIYHHKSKFFIQYKDKQCINGKIFEAPITGYQDKTTWSEIFEHDPDTMVDYMAIFEDFYAIQVRRNGLSEILIRNIDHTTEKTIRFPEPAYAVDLIDLPDYYAKDLRYSYNSLNRPCSIFNYHPASDKSSLLKQTEINGFNPDHYTVERIYATATDGIKIPMSLLYKNGLVQNGQNPMVLYSYGAYGVSTDARFMSTFYSLIDRGFILALAHIRGGSELGEQWYEDGKLLNKKNTFSDFISCSEHLINERYTHPSFLTIMGGSAGGLLVTAVANVRPELFNSVVAIVPFVDVINTMLDSSLPLTTQEYEEWGDPHIKDFYDYILSYSPYDNIHSIDYPHMLVTAGLNDSQVGYHEPAKYVSKLRQYKTDDNILLLRTNMKSGHGGATGRFNQLREIAFENAFILDRIGIKE